MINCEDSISGEFMRVVFLVVSLLVGQLAFATPANLQNWKCTGMFVGKARDGILFPGYSVTAKLQTSSDHGAQLPFSISLPRATYEGMLTVGGPYQFQMHYGETHDYDVSGTMELAIEADAASRLTVLLKGINRTKDEFTAILGCTL